MPPVETATTMDALTDPRAGGVARSAISVRAILLGTFLSALIAGVAPYNDFVVGNGFLIGCYLPVGFVLCMFLLVVGINAPLRRWMPRRAMSGGALSVVT